MYQKTDPPSFKQTLAAFLVLLLILMVPQGVIAQKSFPPPPVARTSITSSSTPTPVIILGGIQLYAVTTLGTIATFQDPTGLSSCLEGDQIQMEVREIGRASCRE